MRGGAVGAPDTRPVSLPPAPPEPRVCRRWQWSHSSETSPSTRCGGGPAPWLTHSHEAAPPSAPCRSPPSPKALPWERDPCFCHSAAGNRGLLPAGWQDRAVRAAEPCRPGPVQTSRPQEHRGLQSRGNEPGTRVWEEALVRPQELAGASGTSEGTAGLRGPRRWRPWHCAARQRGSSAWAPARSTLCSSPCGPGSGSSRRPRGCAR